MEKSDSITVGRKFLIFSTESCEPCKVLKGFMPELMKSEHGKDIEFIQVDDEDIETLITYNITRFPTVVLLQNGDEIERIVGVKKFDYYINSIKYLQDYIHEPSAGEKDHELYDISTL